MHLKRQITQWHRPEYTFFEVGQKMRGSLYGNPFGVLLRDIRAVEEATSSDR